MNIPFYQNKLKKTINSEELFWNFRYIEWLLWLIVNFLRIKTYLTYYIMLKYESTIFTGLKKFFFPKKS